MLTLSWYSILPSLFSFKLFKKEIQLIFFRFFTELSGKGHLKI